ncbi:type II toxin-antitoxin system PemK/MazF family toxin [Methylobacterium oryzihabitans]|uniref:Type II toxin-antitoxin system PemK/MazF family toxin n=2 Tax=Methylobacterium oryzihabitans TaxID=2499852 RepID=A0A437P8C7_9HYPH|nr:type II toxin-antitoxin system PemK/MazF family toxin [Methylobacterium oryzihabitans]
MKDSDEGEWSFIAERAGHGARLAAAQNRHNEAIRPPKVPPRVTSNPRIRELYWCDMPEDAHLPELWKRRPVIIVSWKHRYYGAVTVIPCSSLDQDANDWSVRIEKGINGNPSWAICDKPMTVAVSRLTPGKGRIPRLGEADFNAVLRKAFAWLPKLPPEPEPEAQKGTVRTTNKPGNSDGSPNGS